jgi:hypothetical protein
MDAKNRDLWYRIEEREHKSTPCPAVYQGIKRPGLCHGDWIEAKRIIVRCGYFYEPNDMPEDLQLEAAYNHVVNRFNAGDAYGSLVISSLKHLVDLVGLRERSFFKNVLYDLRGDWCQAQDFRGYSRRLRTFWYVDWNTCTQVERRVMRHCGIKHPGQSFVGEDYDDYTPPSFESWVQQGLIETVYGFVHPLDIVG